MGSGRGASVREKNITRLAAHFPFWRVREGIELTQISTKLRPPTSPREKSAPPGLLKNFKSSQVRVSAAAVGSSSHLNPTLTVCPNSFDSVQTRCIVKGEAQKSPLFRWFSGSFCFSQDRLFCSNSTRKPLNLIKSWIFTNTPCKSSFLCNAPSMHTVDS